MPRVIQRTRASGLVVPEGAATREEEAGDEGLLVAISPMAYNEADFPNRDAVPKLGEHVLFARYAGKSYIGADGRVYRMMKDKEVTGVRDEPEGVAPAEAKEAKFVTLTPPSMRHSTY